MPYLPLSSTLYMVLWSDFIYCPHYGLVVLFSVSFPFSSCLLHLHCLGSLSCQSCLPVPSSSIYFVLFSCLILPFSSPFCCQPPSSFFLSLTCLLFPSLDFFLTALPSHSIYRVVYRCVGRAGSPGSPGGLGEARVDLIDDAARISTCQRPRIDIRV